MSITTAQAPAASGPFGRHALTATMGFSDFRVVCLFSFLGLALSALAITLGFGAQIAEALAIAG